MDIHDDDALCSTWDTSGLYLSGSKPNERAIKLGIKTKERYLLVSDTIPSSIDVNDTLGLHGYIGQSSALVSIREMCRLVHNSSYHSPVNHDIGMSIYI